MEGGELVLRPRGDKYQTRISLGSGKYIWRRLKTNRLEVAVSLPVCTRNKYSGDPVVPAMLASMSKLTKILCDAFPTRFFGGHIEYGKTSDRPGSIMLLYMSLFGTEFNLKTPTKIL
jgi:hypothetical protein